MTLDEKVALLHGVGMPTSDPVTPENAPSNRGVGYAVGVPRLGIPGIDMSDAAYGVRSSGANGRYSTALPANVAAAASWDPEAAYEYGALIGRELRAQGFNMSLGGGTNLTREPRNGRTFEYLGEDRCWRESWWASSSREPSRSTSLATSSTMPSTTRRADEIPSTSTSASGQRGKAICWRSKLAWPPGHPAAVMCSYNRVNGDFACENQYLLNEVLKKDWQFPGFVLSDWGRNAQH